MREIDRLLSRYSENHQNTTNIVLHSVAVPTIFFATIALIWSVPVPAFIAQLNITFAHILVLPLLYYYFRLSGPAGAAMTLLTIIVFGLINLLVIMDVNVWQCSAVMLIAMWVLQFTGHRVEGKKPSFFEDLRYLLIGPLWWCANGLKKVNINM